jgi:preprotein translocase subunit SecY
MAVAQGVGNIVRIPELKRRILFTLMMLAVYRVGCAVPTPGIDPMRWRPIFAKFQGTLLSAVQHVQRAAPWSV